MGTTTSVVHDLQFGTYRSTAAHRGRHPAWPAMAGLTFSHGRRAGVWFRLGGRAFWCCLDRPCRQRVREVKRLPW